MVKNNYIIYIDNLIKKIAEFFAITGGLSLILIIAITCLNVVGRKLSFPIPGDIELIELLICTAIFFFLPYCQSTRSNIKITIFSTLFPKKLNNFLDFTSTISFLFFASFLAWRMFWGGVDFYKYHDLTMVLNIPKFIFFFPIILSLLVLIFVCLLELFLIFFTSDD
ncbi:MAG: hypothetical protein CFH01_00851 [Alphaproteobacteria bacterium MarineAlpha2_Bin1]|nr:MAG: hypothetical protein CFH01_00851 [Alphaproteobacteria bacterium MarineAlpha2_Bin1]|tara:strand:+ start:95 stop:595 length:501 start_codon:yes stop_codon:yes gene_type:complete